jgi:hypothetical protein
VLIGLVNVHVDGAIDPSQFDSATQLTFFIDGVAKSTFDCVRGNMLQSCSSTFAWDTTGHNGSHTLSASIETRNNVTVLTDPITVTVNNPDPTVTITSPAANDVVFGLVQVHVESAVDQNVLDSADTLSFHVDGTQLSSYNCGLAGFAKACAVTFPWNTAGLTGSHTLTAVITTKNGVAITSAALQVSVFAPSTLSITSPGIIRTGRSAHIHGHLQGSIDHLPISGAEVTVLVKPATGTSTVLRATTDAAGNYSVAFKVTTNATLSAGWHGSPTFGPASATAKLSASLALSCKAVKARVFKGQPVRVSCKVPGLVSGLPVQLQLSQMRTWHTVVVASAGGTNRLLPYRPTTKGKRTFRVYVPASRLFAKSVSAQIVATWV